MVVIFQNKMCNTTFICMAEFSSLKIVSRFLRKTGFSLRAAAGAAAEKEQWEDLHSVRDDMSPAC